jgi:hypothetical protein
MYALSEIICHGRAALANTFAAHRSLCQCPRGLPKPLRREFFPHAVVRGRGGRRCRAASDGGGRVESKPGQRRDQHGAKGKKFIGTA